MINDIIIGIAQKLKQINPEITIYTEDVHQDMKEPCFIILPLEPTQEARLPNRYWRTYPFDVHYFPTPIDKNLKQKEEIYGVVEKLLFELEHITFRKDDPLESLLRGTKMRYEIVDNVLHFFVNYNMFVKQKVEPTELMRTLDHNLTTEE